MSMTVGSATADPGDGAITGSGMALALANALYTYFTAGYSSDQLNYQNPNSTPPDAYVYKVGAATAACGMANAIAGGLVPYMQSNATAHVTDQALGCMPASTAPGTLIESLSAGGQLPIDIPIT